MVPSEQGPHLKVSSTPVCGPLAFKCRIEGGEVGQLVSNASWASERRIDNEIPMRALLAQEIAEFQKRLWASVCPLPKIEVKRQEELVSGPDVSSSHYFLRIEWFSRKGE